MQPTPLIDATHIVVPKEDHEKLQDELEKLTHEVRKLESEKEKERREVKEARERCESDLMNCCRRVNSQSLMNVDPVIQRGVVANQQVEANSTASLGRAEQLPQQERSRTLDAEGSDFQQFFSVFEQVGVLLLHSVLILSMHLYLFL
jgi:transcription elongation GreA/GreB family factor